MKVGQFHSAKSLPGCALKLNIELFHLGQKIIIYNISILHYIIYIALFCVFGKINPRAAGAVQH